MVGVSVAAPPKGPSRDLFRIICALSGACERDCGVLKDGALVDNLELQAKKILRARRLASSSSSVASSTRRVSISPVLSARSAPSSSLSKTSKRRKLPADYYSKMDHTYGYDKSPLLSASSSYGVDEDKAALYMSRGDGSASLIPPVKIGKIEPSSFHKTAPYTPVLAEGIIVNSVTVDPNGSRVSSPLHMDHLSLDKPASTSRPSRPSLDLGASMASTVSSASMHQYELSDMEDSSISLNARYASVHSPYDYSQFTPIRESGRRKGSYGEDSRASPISDCDETDIGSARSRRKGSCYSDTSTASLGERVMPKKLRFEMDALSLYEKEGLDDDMSHVTSAASLKEVESGLVETLQSQVDLLLTENIKALAENARLTEQSQMSACEAEEQALEKRRAAEQLKQQSEQIAELESKFLDVQQRAEAQDGFRREAEVAFQSELDAKSQLVSSLQKQVVLKDEEIGRLTKRVEDISGLFANKMREHSDRRSSLTGRSLSPESPDSQEPELVTSLRQSNLFMDMELERMRASLLEKDREICNLYMHLSTKKNLIDEITKKFVQHMEEAAAAAKASNTSTDFGAAGLSPDGVRFDLDMFLFKNVVDKQRRMEELTAALGVMDREVESLEARVAAKERENTQRRDNQEYLTRTLQSVNAQMCAIKAENERLDASLQEKQARISALNASLEDKDVQIRHLNEQVDVRHTHIDSFISAEKASTGRRSLKNSLFKTRASLFSSNAKCDDNSQRGSVSSVSSSRRGSVSMSRKASGSLDWTDAHRPSVVMADFAKTKRSSVLSDVFNAISAPISDDEDSLFGASMTGAHSTRASYCALEINDDEELLSELFAKA